MWVRIVSAPWLTALLSTVSSWSTSFSLQTSDRKKVHLETYKHLDLQYTLELLKGKSLIWSFRLTAVVARAFWRNKNVLTGSYRQKQFHTWSFILCDGPSEVTRAGGRLDVIPASFHQGWNYAPEIRRLLLIFLILLPKVCDRLFLGLEWTWMTVWRCLRCSLNDDAEAQKALIAFSVWCSPASPLLSSAIIIHNPVGVAAAIGHGGLIATLRRYSGAHKRHLQTRHESHTWKSPVWRRTFRQALAC